MTEKVYLQDMHICKGVLLYSFSIHTVDEYKNAQGEKKMGMENKKQKVLAVILVIFSLSFHTF